MEAAKFYHILNFAWAGTVDLMASEGKYHLTCYRNYIRQTSKVQATAQESDIAMAWLCAELEEASGKGNILELSEVWERYCDLCRETNEECIMNASFKSRSTSFKQ